MSTSGLNLERYLIPLDEINRATENFTRERYIGGGGFGAVYKGQLSERWQSRIAAIKRLAPDSHQGEREFHNELELISRFQHENIISFLGYCDEDNEMIIVYEYALNGSLDYHLQDPNKMSCMTWKQRLEICIGAARGLDYLHSGLGEHNRVIHRDVKSANILLDDNMVAKICDFGLSKLGPRNQLDTQIYTKVAGTQFYLDPAYHESRILKKESDVYSFGVVLFEILSGMLAYRERSIKDDRKEFMMTFVRRHDQKELLKLTDQKELHMLTDPYIKNQIDIRSFDTFTKIAYQCISFSLKERPRMDMVIERLVEAFNIQDIAGTSIEFDVEEMGFSNGIPVAAVTIYKCLLRWNYMGAERTTLFDQLVQFFAPEDDGQDNNNKMAYWLSHGCALLFLIQKSHELHSASSVPKPKSQLSSSLFGRMTLGFRSSPTPINLAETKTKSELKVVQQVEAKYPALLFRQQLTAYVEKFYGTINHNLMMDLVSLLPLCIQAPKSSKTKRGQLRSQHVSGKDSQFHQWKGIVDCLNTLLNTLKENYVPPVIVRNIFAKMFTYINTQVFNSILLKRECCTLYNGDYVKSGLEELRLWCCEAKEVYAGTAWDELKHIRQAVGFLAIHNKQTMSYDEIANDLCPILSVTQLYRICTLYHDDISNTQSVPHDVITRMRKQISEDSDDASSSVFLLDFDENSSRISFTAEELSTFLQVEDFEEVKVVVDLAKYDAFILKNGRKLITFGHGVA